MGRKGVKTGRIYIKLYISIFSRQNFPHPPKVFLSETLYVELPKNLVICFKGTLASLLLDTAKAPHSCLFLVGSEQQSLGAAGGRPGPSARGRLQSPWAGHRGRAGSTLGWLAVGGLEPFMFIWGRPQPFARYLGPALIFVWDSALRQGFNFCFQKIFAKDFCN